MSVEITWFGTACFLIEFDATKLLFDPFFMRNDRATPILKTKREDLRDIQGVFITHGHFDHLADAGFFLEDYNTRIYCSSTASKTLKDLINQQILPGFLYSLSKENFHHIHEIKTSQIIEINNNITVEAIESEHIRFDAETIFSRIFSLRFLKEVRSLLPYNRYFPKGEVFGFYTKGGDKRIVSFGSLCDKYLNTLKKFSGCDVLLIPLAGNSTRNLIKKGLRVIEALSPHKIIPIHWDNFFPPLSKTENIKPFIDEVKKNFPDTKISILQIDDSITI